MKKILPAKDAEWPQLQIYAATQAGSSCPLSANSAAESRTRVGATNYLCNSRAIPHVQRSAFQPLHCRHHRYRSRGARDLPEGRDACRPLRPVAHVGHPEILPVFRHALDHLSTDTNTTPHISLLGSRGWIGG